VAAVKKPIEDGRPRRPPATTPEARENQLIVLATDVVENQLREGTASAQVLTHFLKLATVRETLERDKLKSENELLKARVENLASNAKVEELYQQAINAFTSYKGDEVPDEFLD
jgi:hypothetical protein